MASFANVSEVLNRLTGGNSGNPLTEFYSKITAGTTLANYWHSTWLHDGYPGQGVTPGAAAAPTAATAGAFRHVNPSGGRQRWLRGFFAAANGPGRVLLYDRLLHCGGLSGVSVEAQTVGGALTRYTGADSFGNFMLAETYTLVGATQTTITCNYLDATATARSSTTGLFGGAKFRNPGNCAIIPFDVATGANSVTSVTDVTLAETTGTAGSWGVTICRPLAELQLSGNGGIDGSGARMMALEDIEIKDNACLGLLFMGSGIATLKQLNGSYTSVER